MIKRLLSPPVFESEHDSFRASFINGFAWGVIGLLLLSVAVHWSAGPKNFTIAVLSGLIGIMLIALYLLRRGKVDASGVVMIGSGWLGVTLQAFTADGVRDVIVVAFVALGLLAGIIANWRIGAGLILSGIAVVWVLAVLQVNRYFTPSSQDPISYARDLSFVFLAVALLVYLNAKTMRDAVERATTSEKSLVAANAVLQELNQSLEARVEERTAELTMANARNERRARQFEAISQVARVITSMQNEDALLSQLARVIGDHFDFYHVGIFLLNEDSQSAVLRASNSEGGRKMQLRRHKLRVGQAGIVGHVAASGVPRIALDVEADSAFRDNPDLPETRSELALPIKAGERVMGVLDVQSKEANAFQSEDTEVLYTLADQVAIAIQNARSHEATHRLLEEAQRTSISYLKEAWQLLQHSEKRIGYLLSDNTVRPIEPRLDTRDTHKAISQKETVLEDGERATLTVPIRLREDVVGVLDIRLPEGQDWDPDETDIANAVADRLSLALESATLLQSTQRRAEIERLTAEISGKIGASINLRNVLETAVEELGHALPGSEIVIQFDEAEGKSKIGR